MVEQPARIAALVAEWLAPGLCRKAIFTLKLPMKKRYEEAARCRDIIEARLAKAGIEGRLAFKQLSTAGRKLSGICTGPALEPIIPPIIPANFQPSCRVDRMRAAFLVEIKPINPSP
jgi:hypothetical protein